MLAKLKNITGKWSGKRILRNTGITLALLIVLYTVFGFFIVPRIVMSQAREFGTQKLHRTLTLEQVEFNPFTLRATIHGFKLLEAHDAGTFAAFDTLTVKLSWQSLLQFAPVVQQVLLEKPELHVIRETAHGYNFDQLAADLAGPPKPPEKDAQPARFSLYNIQIEGGHFTFEDKPRNAKHEVSEFRLGLPFISSLPSQEEVFVEPLLQAKINGAPFRLAGKALPYADVREATLDLNLDDVDLAHYLEYLPFEPQFKVPSARLDLHVSASFKQLKDHPALTLAGDAALKSLQLTETNGKAVLSLPELTVKLAKSDLLKEHITIARIAADGLTLELAKERDGRLNLQRLFDTGPTTATPAPTEQKPAPAKTESTPLQLAVEEFSLKNAGLHYADEGQAMHAALDKFDLAIKDADIDLGKRRVAIASIESHGADTLLALGAHAPVNVKPDSPTVSTAANAADAKPSFLVTLGKLALDNWTTRIDDRSHAQAASTTLGPLALTVQDISTAPASLMAIDLKSAINKSGQLAANGKLGLSPLHVDLGLDLKAVDLLGVQPYITDKVNLALTSASLTAKGALKLDSGKDNAMQGGFKGDVTLGNLATTDKISGDDFLRWQALSLNGVDAKFSPSAPFSLDIAQVGLNDFFARLIIDADGHINLQDIVRSNPGDKKSLTTATTAGTTAATAQPAPQPPPATQSARPLIRVGKLLLQAGKVRYTDNFIKPHYTANLMDLGGSVGGLSSDPASRATVDLHGQVNDAPLKIAGAINPLKGDLSLDIKAKVTGMELAPLSPYSGRYIGYGIQEGKLSFEVAYQIENRKLTAQNRLILDQLTFGDKVDSPQAMHLPVQFAVSLLRDRNGVIDVNLPIGGSLDDPDFSVGGIVLKVIGNIITKAVEAPFALLGSLFGEGKEMSTAPFDPASAAINSETESRLKAMAKALTERPALKLEITGWTDPESDRPALKHAALDQKLRELKAAGATDSAITPQEYPALLARAYKNEKFAKPRNAIGLAKDLPVADMEKLMLDNITVSDEDLAGLANQRSQAVEQWLIQNGKIPGDRIYVLAPRSGPPTAPEGKSVAPGRVDFSLR